MQGMQAEQDGDLYGGNHTHVLLATLFVMFCFAATPSASPVRLPVEVFPLRD